MNEKKKLNLLPPEAKNKYANKYIKVTASIIAGFFILLILIQYCQIGILTVQTNKILADNQKYNREKETIQTLKDSIANYEAFLSDYENDCFPFSLFMYDLEVYRPSDVYLISVDSVERLINEGVQDAAEDEKKTSEKDKEKDKEAVKEKEKASEKIEEQTDEQEFVPKIEYTEDLSGREIIIRGFGKKQESISKYIYEITHLSYLSNAEITAIEEHKIENGIYNIFEVKVTGGVYQ